jgi:hypothetical protein
MKGVYNVCLMISPCKYSSESKYFYMYTLEYGVMMLEVIFFSGSLLLFLPTLRLHLVNGSPILDNSNNSRRVWKWTLESVDRNI